MKETQTVTLRPATNADTELLWGWRNDPTTRQNSRSTGVVPLNEHREWLHRRLSQPERGPLLIAEVDGEPAGTARLDLSPGETELSWTVAPAQRGKGIGLAIVAECVRRFPEHQPFFATIKEDNHASLRIAERLGIPVRVISQRG